MMNATQSMVGNHDDSQCPTLLHRAHFACEMVGKLLQISTTTKQPIFQPHILPFEREKWRGYGQGSHEWEHLLCHQNVRYFHVSISLTCM